MRECFLCGELEDLQLHHVDWNHANDAAGNRIVLCGRCHSVVHQIGYMSLEELEAVREKVRERAAARFVSRLL